MDDEEHVVFHGPHEPFAQAPEREDFPAIGVIDRRVERTNEERAGYADAIEPLTGDAGLERMQVELDIRELRQALLSVEN